MAIGELTRVVMPPTEAVDCGTKAQWKAIQDKLGLILPIDLCEFGLTYGTGEFCDGFLEVVNPFSPKYQEYVAYETRILRNNKSSELAEFPYDVFPHQPGLFPWGRDENGHTLLWLTQGEPDTWPVIVESHEGKFERFDTSMTTFLAKALTNEIRPEHIWTKPFSDEERTFSPLP